jgi:hypothetical protein
MGSAIAALRRADPTGRNTVHGILAVSCKKRLARFSQGFRLSRFFARLRLRSIDPEYRSRASIPGEPPVFVSKGNINGK